MNSGRSGEVNLAMFMSFIAINRICRHGDRERLKARVSLELFLRDFFCGRSSFEREGVLVKIVQLKNLAHTVTVCLLFP